MITNVLNDTLWTLCLGAIRWKIFRVWINIWPGIMRPISLSQGEVSDEIIKFLNERKANFWWETYNFQIIIRPKLFFG